MVWGSDSRGGDERKAPTGTGYNGIYATYSAFVAIKENGTLFTWGMGNSGVIGAPTDSGYAMSPCTHGQCVCCNEIRRHTCYLGYL